MIEFDHKLPELLHYLLNFYLAYHVHEMPEHYLVNKLQKQKNKKKINFSQRFFFT